jgi:hypothetical protein
MKTDNAERVARLMAIFKWSDNLAQAILDMINTYRKPGTPEYTGLAQVSDGRIRYWVQYNIKRLEERHYYLPGKEQKFQETFNPDPVIQAYKAIDAILESEGVKPTSEGWGFIKDFGYKRVRDTK